VVAAAVVALLLILVPDSPAPLAQAGPPGQEAADTAPVSTPISASRPGSTSADAQPPVLPESAPETLQIPSIGVSTGQLIELGLDPEGALEVPSDAVTTGWYTGGPTPGELGPAVIAAHVNYNKVPGTFARLHELEPGAEATVHRADGTSAVFTIYQVERYPKAEFPTEQVYGNTDGPELRLITCGGDFDPSTGNYVDNVVAYGKLTRVVD
jgi:hypothetical protein